MTTTPTTTNTPFGGNIGAFPPVYSTVPLPLLLQKELALYCQCHCRQCRHFPSEMAETLIALRHRRPFLPVYSTTPPPPPPMLPRIRASDTSLTSLIHPAPKLVVYCEKRGI
ncbi:MAG: hypothetical protein JNJ78_17715 [Anaerolineae bacterium]|nr:hypothetical protein [Anaerolineae bacterium]